MTRTGSIRTCNVPGTSDAALALLHIPPKSRVLDLGCYHGDVSRLLAARGHQVSSCDVVAYAGTADLPDFRQVDANHPLPYEASAFDAILCTEVIEHLENPTNLIRECGRILRTGGVLVLSTPNVGNVVARVQYLLRGELPQFRAYHFENWNHLSPVTPAWIRLTGEKHGLRLETLACEDGVGGWKRRLVEIALAPVAWLLIRKQPGATLRGQTLILRFVKQ